MRHAGFAKTDLITIIVLAAGIFAITLWQFSGGTDGPPPPDTIGWRHDYEAAVQEASAANKPLLLDFTASWCPPCQDMARNVFPRENVSQTIRAHFIPVKVDISDGQGPPADLAQRFNVIAIPTLVIVSPAGNEQGRTVGGLSDDDLLAWLGKYQATTAPR